MPSVNEKILNFQITQQVRWILNQNSVIRQLNPIQREINTELRDLILDIAPNARMSRAHVTDFRKNVLRILTTYRSLVDPIVTKAVKEVAVMAAELEREMLQRFTKSELYGISALDAEKRATKTRWNGSNYNHWRNQHFENDIKRTWRGILGGITTEETPRDMANRVVGTKRRSFLDGLRAVTKRGLEAFTRTSLGHAQEQGKQGVWENNQDVINLVQWVSVLDNATTPYCRRTHNAVGPVTFVDKFVPPKGYRAIRPLMQRPPAHPLCRSATVAFVKKAEDAGIDPATAPGMDGTIPKVPSYSQWLKQQTAANQRVILGAKRYKLYKKTGVAPDRFYNDAGRYIPLAQLRKQMPDNFAKAGI